MRQHAAPMTFPKDGSSYIILSPIELSIRRKIEAVGKPLKEWDVQINYGIKTGCNEAFIITTEKRNELLAQCQSEEERQRTAELIRPILRGRDIKRYSYDWAGLWIIATFPSRHYDIEDYPAVRDYLLHFGKERLEQTGKTYTIGGETFKSRKKTANKWFEVQDSIAYWKDFDRPKVMWKIIGCNINFALDRNSMLCNNAVNIMTGDEQQLLQFVALMNSHLFDWYLKLTTEAEVQGGGIQLYVTTLETTSLQLAFPDSFCRVIDAVIRHEKTEDEIESYIYELYNLSPEEIAFLEMRIA